MKIKTKLLRILIINISLLVGLCLLSPSIWAKATIEEQQERLLEIFGLLHDERLLAAPGEPAPGLGVGLDLSILPQIDTTVGVKKENASFVPAIPRPFLRYGFAKHYFLQGSANPEIEVNGAKARGLSLKFGWGINRDWGQWTVWSSYTTGRVIAPITEPQLPSEDRLEMNLRGLGVAYGKTFGSWTPYLTLEYRNFNGSLYIPEDKTTLLSDFDGMVNGVGVAWKVKPRWMTVLEIAQTPGIVVNPRWSVSYQF